MSKGTLYIAGPVTNGGLTSHEGAVERFRQGTMEVVTMGYVPVSPIEIAAAAGLVEGQSHWREFMKINIPAMMACDGIYCLRGWENSRGARIEQFIANALDMLILYQREEIQ